jgi:hypothetical protein
MPKTKRDFLKRDVAIAVTHIEEAQIRLLTLKEVFDPVHPEQAMMLDAILTILETGISFISDFCMKTWNSLPPSWDLWRNPGTPARKEDPETPDEVG